MSRKAGISIIVIAVLIVGFGFYLIYANSFVDQGDYEVGDGVALENSNGASSVVSDAEESLMYAQINQDVSYYIFSDPNPEDCLKCDYDPLDPSGFHQVGEYILDDAGKKIYYMIGVYGGHQEGYEEGPILEEAVGIDFDDFSVYENDGRYAHDSRNVYGAFNFGFVGVDLFNVIDGADPLTFEPRIVEQFDVSQGNGLQGYISRDKNNIYYLDEIFEHADPVSFKFSEHVSVNTDKNNVYLWRKILPKADPETYEVVRDESTVGQGAVYGKDKNNVFIDYCVVDGVDPESFGYTHEAGLDDRFSDKDGYFQIHYDKEENTCEITRD